MSGKPHDLIWREVSWLTSLGGTLHTALMTSTLGPHDYAPGPYPILTPLHLRTRNVMIYNKEYIKMQFPKKKCKEYYSVAWEAYNWSIYYLITCTTYKK